MIEISDLTINRARIQDAVGQGGQSGGKTEGGRQEGLCLPHLPPALP
ncbi:MAG TPA: hypothetical protein VFU22_12800 [Roseiflexaceae bacterium]|nr:hypothetical protein [Roseiflexaceae bacterium]